MNDVIMLMLVAKNQASQAIKQVKVDLSSLEQTVQSVDKRMASMASGFNAAAAFAGVTAGLVAFAAAAKEASEAAGEVERLGVGFQNLAAQHGESSQRILESLQAVTQGTLDNKTIMQQANNAMLLGVADTAEEFETLAKIAMTRGRAMGISMEYAFESIVKGVGRLSPLILDNLGIVIDADNTYKAYAETIGKTADQLSDMEKRQAILAKLKGEVANFDSSAVLDSAAAWERLSTSTANATVALGAWLNDQEWFINIVNEGADALNRWAIAMNGTAEAKGKSKVKELKQDLEDSYEVLRQMKEGEGLNGWLNSMSFGAAEQVQKDWIDKLTNDIKTAQGEYAQAMTSIVVTGAQGGKAFVTELDKGAQESERIASEMAKAGPLVSDYARALGISKEEATAVVEQTVKLNGSFESAVGPLRAIIDGLEAAKAKAQEFNSIIGSSVSSLESVGLQAYKNSGFAPEVLDALIQQSAALDEFGQSAALQADSALELKGAMAQAEEGAVGYFQAINEAAEVTTKTASGPMKQLTEEFQNLRGVVSSLFSEQLADIGGAKIEDYLPGAGENVDAPARRIADVMVKGFNSPWVDYFKNTFPGLWSDYMGKSGGDVQKGAALLLADFQKGLRPELLDTNYIKMMAKAMFTADQQTSQMIDQMAKELAGELGISVEKAAEYVGSASGKKRIVSQEELDALKEAYKIGPEFNMSGAKDKIQKAGKDSGVINSDGNIYIPFMLEPAKNAEGGTTLFVPGFDAKTIPAVAVPFQLTPDPAAAPLVVSPITVTAVPQIELPPSSTDTQTSALTIPIYPAIDKEKMLAAQEEAKGELNKFNAPLPMSYDPASAATAKEAMKTDLKGALTDPEAMNAAGAEITANLGAAMTQQGTNLQVIGVTTGSQIFQGFATYNLGALMAGELARQLSESQKSFEASAKNAGTTWGSAFLQVVGQNVPFELIVALTDLITPEVLKKIQEAKGRGGGQ